MLPQAKLVGKKEQRTWRRHWELKELRKENQSFTNTKASLFRLETSVTDLKQRMEKLEQKVEETETRVGVAEDTSQRHERMLIQINGLLSSFAEAG